MKKVKITHPFRDKLHFHTAYTPGEIKEFDDARADEIIARGLAEPLEAADIKSAENTAPADKPEPKAKSGKKNDKPKSASKTSKSKDDKSEDKPAETQAEAKAADGEAEPNAATEPEQTADKE